jgi:hypothetical protein
MLKRIKRLVFVVIIAKDIIRSFSTLRIILLININKDISYLFKDIDIRLNDIIINKLKKT